MSDVQPPLPLDRGAHGGWFRVEEAAIRKLKATFDSPASFRKAQLAYMVLLRIANLEGSDTFSRRVASLADDFGYNYDEAAQALKLVQQAGLLEIVQQTVPGSRELAPSRYRVVRMLPDIPATYPDNPATLPEKEARFPEIQKPDQSPRVSKNSPKNVPITATKREASPSQTRFSPPSLSEAEAEAVKNGMPGTEGQAFIDHHQAKGWIIGKSPMKDWRAAMRTWKRNWEKFQTNGHFNGKKPSGLQDHQTF